MAASPLLRAPRQSFGPYMRSPSTSPGLRWVCCVTSEQQESSTFPDGVSFPSAGSVHLADLLHGGGRRAGHTSAEQLPTHPPHLQPRRVHVQGCQTPPGVVLSPAQVGSSKAAASRSFARRFRLQVLTGSIICLFLIPLLKRSPLEMYCKSILRD